MILRYCTIFSQKEGFMKGFGVQESSIQQFPIQFSMFTKASPFDIHKKSGSKKICAKILYMFFIGEHDTVICWTLSIVTIQQPFRQQVKLNFFTIFSVFSAPQHICATAGDNKRQVLPVGSRNDRQRWSSLLYTIFINRVISDKELIGNNRSICVCV